MYLTIYANNISMKDVLALVEPLEYCYTNCLLLAKVQDDSALKALTILNREGKLEFLYKKEP